MDNTAQNLRCCCFSIGKSYALSSAKNLISTTGWCFLVPKFHLSEWIYCLVSTELFPNYTDIISKGFPGGTGVKNGPVNARDVDAGLIPGSGRCPEGINGNPLRATVHVAAKSQTQLSTHAHTKEQNIHILHILKITWSCLCLRDFTNELRVRPVFASSSSGPFNGLRREFYRYPPRVINRSFVYFKYTTEQRTEDEINTFLSMENSSKIKKLAHCIKFFFFFFFFKFYFIFKI